MDRKTFANLSAAELLFPRHAQAAEMQGVDLWRNRVCEVRIVLDGHDALDLRVSTRLVPLEGRPHAVCTWTDITQQKAVQQELRLHRDGLQELVTARTHDLKEAKDAAEQANRAKSEFLSNMSHELRTPMHAILSFARLGRDRVEKVSPEKLRHYYQSVLTSGDRLLALLNDLLDLSKLEAGMMTMQFAREDLRRIVEQVVAEFSPLAREKRLRIELVSSLADSAIVCDAARLCQVFNNLLSNAVKFTPPDRVIRLSIDLAHESMVPAAVSVSVRDQGVGIPDGELEKVFDKFVQSSKTRSGAGGTGLGLSISREIVALHGGTISASNNSGGGACFTVVLPREPASESVPAAAAPAAPSATLPAADEVTVA